MTSGRASDGAAAMQIEPAQRTRRYLRDPRRLSYPAGLGGTTARILLLDAKQEPPTHSIALTTRDPGRPPRCAGRHPGGYLRRLRRRYGRVEYFGRIEFTTGRGPRSGGARRIHGHYVVKGLAGVKCMEAEEIVRESWRRSLARHGSSFEAWRIEVAETTCARNGSA